MTIRFICSCGKHLKARDEMASRRSFCPRCGKPVGIPSLKPTARGTPAAPMSLLDRFKTKRAVPRAEIQGALEAPPAVEVEETPPAGERPIATAGRPLDFSLVRLILGRKHYPRRPAWPLEEHWYECLIFPFRAWALVFGLALVLTVWSGSTALLFAEMVRLPKGDPGFPALCICWGFVTLVVLAYTVGFLECTLSAALAGEVGQIRWTGENFRLALRSTGRWSACFLAGPVIPAVTGFVFWLKSGDLNSVDWFILAELTVVSVGYWMLALTAAGKRDRLLDANPARVMEIAEQIGMVGVTALVIVALFAVLEITGTYGAMELLRDKPAKAIALLSGCWLSAMLGFTFLMRLLGVFCFERQRPEEAEEAVQEEAAVT